MSIVVAVDLLVVGKHWVLHDEFEDLSDLFESLASLVLYNYVLLVQVE